LHPVLGLERKNLLGKLASSGGYQPQTATSGAGWHPAAGRGARHYLHPPAGVRAFAHPTKAEALAETLCACSCGVNVAVARAPHDRQHGHAASVPMHMIWARMWYGQARG